MLCAVATQGLGRAFADPSKVLAATGVLDPPSLGFLILLLVLGGLGTYAAAVFTEGLWGGLGGMAAAACWTIFIYLQRNGFQGKMPGDMAVAMQFGIGIAVLLAGVNAGLERAKHGIPRITITLPQVAVGLLAFLVGPLGFGLPPLVSEWEDGTGSAAIWGASCGTCFWVFRFVHP